MNYPQIYLKPGKEIAVKRRHLWIFSGAIARMDADIKDGDIVKVCTHKGAFLCLGHYQDGSIAIRIIAFEEQAIDQKFWDEKIKQALRLRQALGLVNSSETNVYRLFHAEGDGVPGLIIDIYAQTAVIQAHSIGVYLQIDLIAQALQNCLGKQINCIYDKSSETLPKKFAAQINNHFLLGEAPSTQVQEYGHRFQIDWITGQKTGFFIDQRENRALLARYSKGKKVLNTFCYSGGFSVYALQSGATEIHSVDISAKAIALTEENIALNPSKGKHEAITADVVKYIREIGDDFDVVILDPPAFAKSQNARHNAVQGYKRLNAEALKKIKSGGILFTFSCSQVVDKALFANTIAAAAIEVGREIKILHYLSQPGDHPINIYHPESEYLKGLVLYVS
ncbi:class I SAM-dependent rRNA methyltransferase [Penaeicola halotolerans]|uniref:class I SAM-dependent rRNA methyltransferase n=1 Tax=Penaeicola halotolerans TaxID=2793196 RepID=UPI001CF89F17|nr:class I SAM-dependent rRNA methyltransferase [Penaeicola halotolerans]